MKIHGLVSNQELIHPPVEGTYITGSSRPTFGHFSLHDKCLLDEVKQRLQDGLAGLLLMSAPESV